LTARVDVADARPPRVALDAMGGDDAPAATVAGALLARDEDGIDTVLVGDRDVLTAALERAGASGALDIVHAGEVVGMDEDPALALRSKRGASIRVAADLVADGGAAALVSAGSTGATLAAALFAFGRVPGVRRPAVAAVIPLGSHGMDVAAASSRPEVVLVDAGATSDVQPAALVTYALMGSAYARVRGVARPRIGLLNVGEEPGKGNAVAKAAFSLLADVDGFVGNVEPPAVLGGAVDVAVADGFTGNVFLKTIEALRHDPDEPGAGGAVLLGCSGTVIVAHGAAAPREIAAALRTAHEAATGELAARVAEGLAADAEDREDEEDDGG
jgi:phosphate acyltransferase